MMWQNDKYSSFYGYDSWDLERLIVQGNYINYLWLQWIENPTNFGLNKWGYFFPLKQELWYCCYWLHFSDAIKTQVLFNILLCHL